MDHDLLRRYTHGDCTEEEKKAVENWLNEDVPLSKTFLSRKDEEIQEEAIRMINSRISAPVSSRIRLYRYVSIAAILVLISSAVGLWHQNETHQSELLSRRLVSWKTIDVPDGQKASVKLTDGSTVELNGGSSFSYPDQFTNQRVVKLLKGDAFFIITKDQQHPFIVQTDDRSNIKVLGTRFNVKHNSFSSNLEITLNSGKISFERQGYQSQMLRPGEQLHYNLNSYSISVPVAADTLIASGWRKNILVFKDTPIKQMFREIEQCYGVKFMPQKGIKEQFMNAEFTAEPLSSVLNMISTTSKLKFKQIGQNIYVNP